jgi:cellulose synthase/poly-beta-1,6-N-acetylglucosamine synthase-like glycosyltransferase
MGFCPVFSRHFYCFFTVMSFWAIYHPGCYYLYHDVGMAGLVYITSCCMLLVVFYNGASRGCEYA